jgi:hypothetical protein
MGKKRLKPPSKMRQPLLTFIINNLPASALYHHTTCHAENRLIFSAGWMGGRAQYMLRFRDELNSSGPREIEICTTFEC